MAYVDLNPIRAKMAETPESSDHTSIQQRITAAGKGEQPRALLAFVGNPRKHMPKGLPFELVDYLELVELTGRSIRLGKRGFIAAPVPVLLSRLNICPDNWFKLVTEFKILFHGPVGHSEVLSDFCQHQQLKRRPT